MRKELKKKKAIYIVSIFVLLVILIGISYALLQKVLVGSKEQIVRSGNLSLIFGEEKNAISLTEAYPVSDSEGLASSGFSFIVENNGNVGADYELSLEDVPISENQVRLSDDNIKYSLTKKGEVGDVTILSSVERKLDSGYIGAKETRSYELKLWLREDFSGEIEGQVFKAKLKIQAMQGEDKNLASRLIKDYSNDSSITSYQDGDKTKMYTFLATVGEQQVGYTAEELTEYRYIGNVPNNYIKFNDELWRIIGVFTVEDKDGKKEQRVKIMRSDSLGTYSWDSSYSETDYGKNRWSDARLMRLLNPGYENQSIGGSLYYNKGKGQCYANKNDGAKACDFTTIGLSTTAKDMIKEAKWYVAGDRTNSRSTTVFYKMERGTTVYSSVTHPREISWIGHVGLIYPSDYGYTYSLGINPTCYDSMISCSNASALGWMVPNSSRSWTLTPYTDAAEQVFMVDKEGLSFNTAYWPHHVYPSLYLKPTVKINAGTGTDSDPFIVE